MSYLALLSVVWVLVLWLQIKCCWTFILEFWVCYVGFTGAVCFVMLHHLYVCV